MNELARSWSRSKYEELVDQLTGYWAEDIWDLKNIALDKKWHYKSFLYLTFLCPSISVNNELKYAVWQKFIRQEWSVTTTQHLYRLLRWFRDEFSSDCYSLTERSLAYWESQFGLYLKKRGVRVFRENTWIIKTKGVVKGETAINHMSALRSIYEVIYDYYDQRPEYEKDIWRLSRMGISGHRKVYDRFNFTKIHQSWLRKPVKQYIHYRLAHCSASHCFTILSTLGRFSSFLLEHHPYVSASKINRALIIEYIGYLISNGLTVYTRLNSLISLRMFLEISVREEWASFPKERIIYSEDLPKMPKMLPRYIPDFVIRQLFQNVAGMPVRFQRMVYLLYEVGMRGNELFKLSYNCLMQDSEGSWWIKYYQSKLKAEHTQPITAEIASIIQAQQQEAVNKWGGQVQLLFPNLKGQPYSRNTLSDQLNKLAIEKNICDSTGKIWWFELHQFRHTFGTRHINNGLPHHIIQRLMGHKSPGMTSVYAHIHDKTLKQEFEKALGQRKLIDISGRVISENTAADATELQWLKNHVDARTLPNGYCGIPIALGPCPHPNACLTCPHFRTDQTYLENHQKQLEETGKLVQISRANGWKVQTENNEKLIAALEKIIVSLKETNDVTSA